VSHVNVATATSACLTVSGHFIRVLVQTVGHGTRPLVELVSLLREAEVETLIDVRRYPGSRRNPQFNRSTLGDALREADIGYVHAVDLGGRLADEPGEERPRLEVIYVMDLPLTVPLDAPPPRERVEEAEIALQRAKEVGEEYESVEVETAMVPARTVGAGIVEEARRRGVEVIVMGGEPPSRMKGGAVLGGVGGSRPPEVGEVTEYVLKKAPCPVLVTAPPEG